jgi:hypothetical protein
MGMIGMMVLAACGGAASPIPTPDAGNPDGQGDTPTPTPIISTDDTPEPGDGSDAFSAATTALDALDSYAFRVELKTTTTDNGTVNTSDAVYSGVVVNQPTAARTLVVSELDADGNVTSGTEYVVIGADAWLRDVGSEDWVSMPAAQIGGFLEAFRPEQMFGTYFAGIAGNFASAGSESKNGVDTTHYKGDESVGALLGTLAGVAGDWHSDVWIANDGGFLVHSEAGVEAAAGAEGGSFLIVVDITDPNSAGPIEPPA